MNSMNRAGVSLTELLIAMAIVGTVLLLLVSFFQQQARVSSQVQARNEVQTKVRTAAEILMQDLQVAGSRATFDGTSVNYDELKLELTTEPADPTSAQHATWRQNQCSTLYREGCVVVTPGAGGGFAAERLTIYYRSSLRSEHCRQVVYDHDAQSGILYRADVVCGAALGTLRRADNEFASQIDGIWVSFICHDPETSVADIAACYSATTYPRQATVTVQGRSENARENIPSTVTLATGLPNLRPPVDYLDLN